MNKGLDAVFMNYGIRNEDMEIIKKICEEANIDFDWFKDFILKEYHELKMKNEEMDAKSLQKLVEKALSN
ncbi:hypothetical protein J8N07_07055 [Chryseobacterium arthrosphaerae]|uniref:DNA modification system-associated small protein n=1 Tax=Chryseobacterium TaxID=59732 RepID=UPI0008105628|nr:MULTISPECIES: DNA modification system-associated small protein [Chryseobacterium]OCK51058.1 hypothetical protein BA768_18310 [Chryseobacterium sp. CBo1]UEQ78052.1 hypothetical protein J8N07_07055 [Chryseobacterium arthrosphaerae]VXC33301.1 conserved hypothetical protein [Chryseobacterium sp. 8AT]